MKAISGDLQRATMTEQGIIQVNRKTTKLNAGYAYVNSEPAKRFQYSGNPIAESVLLIPEITLRIFSYLQTKDICRLARVCTLWRKISRDQELLTNINLENCSACRDIHFIALLKTIGTANLPKVISVNIAGTGINGEILLLLTLWCPEIQFLKLSGTQMNRKILVRVAKSLKQLRSLSVRECDDIDQEFIKILVQEYPKLHKLHLPISKNLDDEALKEIANGFPELQALDISSSPKITDAGLELVIQYNRKLKSLDVSGCNVLSYTTVVSLTRYCSKLRVIRALNTNLTDSGINVLLENPPNKEARTFSIIANPSENMEIAARITRIPIH